MNQTEQAALLALLRDRKSGWGEVTEDVESRGSALEVLIADVTGAGQVELSADEPDRQVEGRLAAAMEEIDTWAAKDVKLVTLLDPNYPAQLLTVHQRPPFLFYRGHLDPRDASGVAVVGTRRPSPRALQRARDIAGGLARRQVPVISGLATGVDAAAHGAALDEGSRTVAVIGTGLEHSYPTENRRLQEQIAREHLVLSQFWPDAPPTKKSFLMRNAVMSGYAAATVVVEAGERSGARVQARLALEHGRPLFLLDTLLEHDWARAYRDRPGTRVVHDAADVLRSLDELLTPTDQLVWA